MSDSNKWTYKSTYQILLEIAQVWEDISDVSQATLLEDLAGKRNTNVILSIINNLQDLEGAYETASDAAGTSAAANDIYMDSIEGRLGVLSATAEEFANALDIEDLIKGAINLATGFVDVTTDLTEVVGGLPGLIGLVGTSLAALKISKYINQVGGLATAFSDLSTAASSIGTGTLVGGAIAAGVLLISTAYSQYQQYIEDLINDAAEVSDTFQAATSDIDSYAERVEELQETLADKNITDEESYAAKSELLEIQSALIESYGDEADVLDLIANNGQNATESLREYTKALAESAVEESQDAYDKAVQKLNQIRQYDAYFLEGVDGSYDTVEELRKQIDSYSTLSLGAYNNGAIYLTAKGSAEEVQADVEALYKWMEEYAETHDTSSTLFAQWQDGLESMLDQTDTVIDKWSTTRDEHLAEVVVANDNYNAIAENIEDAVEQAQQAILNGDYSDLSGIDLSAIAESIENVDDDEVRQYLQDMLDEAGSTLNPVKIAVELEDDTSELSALISRYESLSGTNATKYGMLNSQYGDDSAVAWYEAMENAASEYDLTAEELIDTLVELGYVTDDTADATLAESIRELGEAYSTALQTLRAFNNETVAAGTSNEQLQESTATVSEYLTSLQALEEYMLKADGGEATAADMSKLRALFPELQDETGDFDDAVRDLYKTVKSGTLEQLNKMFDSIDSEQAREELLAFLEQFDALVDIVGNTEFSVDIEAETEGMEALTTAMQESVSATGLTADSIEALKERYQDLQGYDPSELFERTENGIRLNTDALQELQSEYQSMMKQGFDDQLQDLKTTYDELTTKIENCTDASERSELGAERDDILQQISNVADLASQYEGLTSSYNKWLIAQDAGEQGDMYDTITSSLEDIAELYEQGLVGTNEFRAFVQMMTDEDLSTASAEQLMAVYEKGYPVMERYFQDSSDGVLNFLNDLEALDNEWVTLNEDGSWDINFGIGDDEEVAKALSDMYGIQVSAEELQIILRKLHDYGFDIDLDSCYTDLEDLKSIAEQANDTLQSLGKGYDYTFNLDSTDVDDLTEQIEVAQGYLNDFIGTDGVVDLSIEGASEAQWILYALLQQMAEVNKPAVMTLDVSDAESDLATMTAEVQDFYSAYQDYVMQVAIGADTTQVDEAKQKVDAAFEELDGNTLVTSLQIDTTDIDTAAASIEALTTEQMVEMVPDLTELMATTEQIEESTTTATIETSTDTTEYDETVAEIEATTINSPVKVNVDDTAWDNLKEQVSKTTLQVKVQTTTTGSSGVVTTATKKSSSSTSTSKASSSSSNRTMAQGNAFAGAESAPSSNKTLGGQLGEELVVFIKPHRPVMGEKNNLFNSWNTLKATEPQRNYEIWVSAKVVKTKKIGCMRYGASLSLE